MGLTYSARIFTKVALFGVRIILYIDDLVVLANTESFCQDYVTLVVEEIEKFWFILNEKKSCLVPAQTFTYLGTVWDTIG